MPRGTLVFADVQQCTCMHCLLGYFTTKHRCLSGTFTRLRTGLAMLYVNLHIDYKVMCYLVNTWYTESLD